MQNDLIHILTESFEGHAQATENGIEYWLARDVQHLLGYAKWDNFLNVISKAKTACELSEHPISDHFADVGKMVELGSGSQREISDIMLTRKAEVIEQRLLEAERVTNNKAVRDTLISRGIRPESLPPAEDVKKVERRLTSAEKKALKNPETLENGDE